MALGLYELINNINKQIKSICCKVNALLDSGAGSYKVYTALLTQSGGDTGSERNDGDLIVGVTYTIQNSGGDFTNVGAPNNNVGTSFVATGTTPNNWGGSTLAYVEGAPVVTVLENTIGNIWFTYNDVGVYHINSIGLFNENKTFVTISPTVQNSGDSLGQTIQFVGGSESTINTLVIQTEGALQDGIPNNTPIEIRVYS
jgi:hypothetical protein